MSKLIDRTGKTYGKLVVKSFNGTINGVSYWNCVCSCGKKTVVSGGKLNNGQISCGCFLSRLGGKSSTKLYNRYRSIYNRCYNENTANYKYYGALGISMCSRWKESFNNFLEDMGEPPKGTTLDRIDYTKGYSPDNCRWATRKDQQNNRRINHVIEYMGDRKTITQWAEELGLGVSTIQWRLKKGWDVNRALGIPARKKINQGSV